MNIERVIKSLRETDHYIKTIFIQGGCYKFHLFLRSIFPTSKAMINKDGDHIITEYKGEYYDITGKLLDINVGYDFNYLTLSNLKMVEGWSFSGQKMLSLGECTNCEEPLLF